MRRNPREGGFTLVETAATVVLSSVALVATAGAVTSGARLARTTAETRAAVRASKTVMESIRGTTFSLISETFDDACISMHGIGDGNSSGLCEVDIADVATGSTAWKVLKVTVNSQWHGSVDANRAFVTYVCDRTTGTPLGAATVLGADENVGGPPPAHELRVRGRDRQ